MRNLMLALTLVASSLCASGLARADVPGPREVCEDEGLGCTTCTTTPGGDPDFDKCVSDATAKGLVLACEDGSASVQSSHYCPKGVTVPKSTTGGSSGCAVGSGAAGELMSAGAALTMIALLALARRSRAARA